MDKTVKNKVRIDALFFFIVTLLGFFIRYWWVVNIPNTPVSDFGVYQDIATNIYKGKGITYLGHPISFQGMGYPMLLGLIYCFFDSNNILIAKLSNVVFSVITLIVVYLILKEIINNRIIIYISYSIITFFPNYIAYTNVLGTEILATLIFAIMIYLQLRKTENIIVKYSVLGIFVGLATLVKPFFLAYPFIVGITVWLKNKELTKSCIAFGLTTLVMIIILSPWTYHNYKKFNMFIPVSYNDGYVLFINNNDDNVHGGWMPVGQVKVSPEFKEKLASIGFVHGSPLEDELKQTYNNPKLNYLLKQEAKNWIMKHPKHFIELGLIRIKNVFFSGAQDIYDWCIGNKNSDKSSEYQRNINLFLGVSSILVYIVSSVSFMFIILSIGSIVYNFFCNKTKQLPDMIIIPTLNTCFFIGIYFVFEGQARYNFPSLFLLVIMTVYTLNIMSNDLIRKHKI